MFEWVNDNQVLEYLLVLPTKFSTVRLLISFKKPIDLRRVFLRYVNISMCKFDGSVSCPGLYGGLYGQNLPYKFKKSYGDFRSRNFEKSHRTTGPR